jgi:hypothetical protein
MDQIKEQYFEELRYQSIISLYGAVKDANIELENGEYIKSWYIEGKETLNEALELNTSLEFVLSGVEKMEIMKQVFELYKLCTEDTTDDQDKSNNRSGKKFHR